MGRVIGVNMTDSKADNRFHSMGLVGESKTYDYHCDYGDGSKPHDLPSGMPLESIKITLMHLHRAGSICDIDFRHLLGATIEYLIDLLDSIDGDSDFEENADCEADARNLPSLGLVTCVHTPDDRRSGLLTG